MNHTEENNNNEIDLFYVLNYFAKLLKKLVCELLTIIKAIINTTIDYIVVFIIVIATVIGLTVYQNTGNRKIYQGEILLKLNVGDASLYAQQIDKLEHYVKTRDAIALSEALSLTEEESKKIHKIESNFFILLPDSVSYIIDYDKKYADGDTTYQRIPDKIAIKAYLKDRDLYSKLQASLINYFNNNTYLKKQLVIRQQDISEKEKTIDRDLKRLDSLQQREFFEQKKPEVYLTDRTTLNTGHQDLYYQDKLLLIKQKEEMEEDLSRNGEVSEVIIPFQPSQKIYKSLLCQIASNCIFVYFIVFLIMYIFSKRECILKWAREDCKESDKQ